MYDDEMRAEEWVGLGLSMEPFGGCGRRLRWSYHSYEVDVGRPQLAIFNLYLLGRCVMC